MREFWGEGISKTAPWVWFIKEIQGCEPITGCNGTTMQCNADTQMAWLAVQPHPWFFLLLIFCVRAAEICFSFSVELAFSRGNNALHLVRKWVGLTGISLRRHQQFVLKNIFFWLGKLLVGSLSSHQHFARVSRAFGWCNHFFFRKSIVAQRPLQ